MTKANFTATINQHAYTADGVHYRFNVAMVAREPLWSGATRYLCAVEVHVDGTRHQPVIYVLIGTRIPRNEVIQLLEEALQDHLEQEKRPTREVHVSPAVSGPAPSTDAVAVTTARLGVM